MPLVSDSRSDRGHRRGRLRLFLYQRLSSFRGSATRVILRDRQTFSYIDPGGNPNVLNRQPQPQDQFHRIAQHTLTAKLGKSHIGRSPGPRQELLLQTRSAEPAQRTHESFLEVDRHQPVKEHGATT